MKQIADLGITRLRIEELFGHVMKTYTAGRAMLPEEAKAVLDELEVHLNKLDDLLEQSRKNSFTAQQIAADQEFDRVFVHAFEYARVMPYFPVPEAAAAAEKILAIFERYGNFTQLGYTEEYAKGHNLIQDIQALGEDALTAANFTPWLEALTLKHAQFTVLRESKQAEDTSTITGATKEARKALEEAYHLFVKKINAMYLIMGEEKYGPYIDQVNTYVAEMQTILKARTTRNANKKEEEGGEEETPETPETENE